MIIHLLNLIKAILESQGLEHREHAILCRDKMCQEFLRLLSVSVDLPFASQQNIILKLILKRPLLHPNKLSK